MGDWRWAKHYHENETCAFYLNADVADAVELAAIDAVRKCALCFVVPRSKRNEHVEAQYCSAVYSLVVPARIRATREFITPMVDGASVLVDDKQRLFVWQDNGHQHRTHFVMPEAE